jgi:L-threonylcarbamoyladenylate synthase
VLVLNIITTEHTDVVQIAVNSLKKDGVVVVPTIRWYMICCAATNPEGLDIIFTAKNRSHGKPPLFLVPDKETVEKMFMVNDYIKALMCLWPGELAMHLSWSSKTDAENYCLQDKEHALVAMLPGLFGDIVSRYSAPLLSTTVNISNIDREESSGPAISLEEVLTFINETDIKVDLVIDGGICPAFNHTTLIDCRMGISGKPIILREGYVHKRTINYVLDKNNGDHDDER